MCVSVAARKQKALLTIPRRAFRQYPRVDPELSGLQAKTQTCDSLFQRATTRGAPGAKAARPDDVASTIPIVAAHGGVLRGKRRSEKVAGALGWTPTPAGGEKRTGAFRRPPHSPSSDKSVSARADVENLSGLIQRYRISF